MSAGERSVPTAGNPIHTRDFNASGNVACKCDRRACRCQGRKRLACMHDGPQVAEASWDVKSFLSVHVHNCYATWLLARLVAILHVQGSLLAQQQRYCIFSIMIKCDYLRS